MHKPPCLNMHASDGMSARTYVGARVCCIRIVSRGYVVYGSACHVTVYASH